MDNSIHWRGWCSQCTDVIEKNDLINDDEEENDYDGGTRHEENS